jgi:thioredoxin 1
LNRTLTIALGIVLFLGGAAAVWTLPGKSAPVAAGPSAVLQLTSAAFPGLKAQSKPVVMDFWAPWCPPCRTQGPLLEQFATQVGDRAIVVKVNVDDEKALAAQFEVQAIPTLIILKDGKVAQRLVGVHSVEALQRALDAPGV